MSIPSSFEAAIMAAEAAGSAGIESRGQALPEAVLEAAEAATSSLIEY